MPSHDELRKNVNHHHDIILDAARSAAVEYQHQRGKLTARERIVGLVDEGTFLEFGGLALPDDNDEARPSYADGLITGWSEIEARPVMVSSADFTVNGGSNGSIGLEKMRTSYERCLNDGVPMVQLLEGVGHRISEGLDSRLFAPGVDSLGFLVQMSGWVPNVAAMLGQGYAAMTIVVSMCDFVVMVEGMSSMGIAPPPLVKAAVGETIDSEQLGGANVQANGNGVADVVVATEQEAFTVIKQYLSYFPSNSAEPPPTVSSIPADEAFAEKLATIIPTDMRYAYDVRHVIKGIVDAGSMFEIKAGYAKNIVCTLARIGGRPIGIVANQPNHLAGALDSPACEKASHFICLCDAFGIALLSLIDLPGLMVGSKAEQSKLARRSARLVYELGRTTVPTYSIVLRKAYGGAYMGMNGGRSFGAALSLAWPTAEFAAMNVETAVDVAYKREVAGAKNPVQARDEIIQRVRSQLGPVRAAGGFGIDDVILPEQTRDRLQRVLKSAPIRKNVTHATPRIRAIPPI